jgi:nicotinate-nucleotide pyrophosphorylase (carboxylating)
MNCLKEQAFTAVDSARKGHMLGRMNAEAVEQIIRRALAEDLPDITADAIFGPEDEANATLVAKAEGVIAGHVFAEATFRAIDPDTIYEIVEKDGAFVRPGTILARIGGRVRALLAGERTALNLMQRASGIATLTRRYVDEVRETKAKICDTRKTAPGLRALDKYAVTVGGGFNHRLGLFDMFLIKNNHIDRAGSLRTAVDRVRQTGRPERIMVEVRNQKELEEALQTRPDFILLDNMSPDHLREAVLLVAGRVPLEASGGVTLQNVRKIAETGVDRISIGALTHSVRALDISMRIQS